MTTGRVKFYNGAKGFGFIVPDDNGADLFFHANGINENVGRPLEANEPVEFEVERGKKGENAVNVRPLSQPI